MARSGYLNVTRKRHGIIWGLLIGWWERPLASAFWLLLAEVSGHKGVKFHYHN